MARMRWGNEVVCQHPLIVIAARNKKLVELQAFSNMPEGPNCRVILEWFVEIPAEVAAEFEQAFGAGSLAKYLIERELS